MATPDAQALQTGWWFASGSLYNWPLATIFYNGHRGVRAGPGVFLNFEFGTIASGIDPSVYLGHKQRGPFTRR